MSGTTGDHTVTYIQLHTYIHTITYLQLHTYIHIYSYIYTVTYIQLHTYSYIQLHTYMHACIHTYIYKFIPMILELLKRICDVLNGKSTTRGIYREFYAIQVISPFLFLCFIP